MKPQVRDLKERSKPYLLEQVLEETHFGGCNVYCLAKHLRPVTLESRVVGAAREAWASWLTSFHSRQFSSWTQRRAANVKCYGVHGKVETINYRLPLFTQFEITYRRLTASFATLLSFGVHRRMRVC